MKRRLLNKVCRRPLPPGGRAFRGGIADAGTHFLGHPLRAVPCCGLLAAIWTTIDFPLGTLGDEWAKIDGVRTGNNRYYHPLLIIEVTQFANLFAGARDRQAIVEVGRACAAFAGCLLVLLACAAGAARARRPGSNICDGGNANRQVHARIMKEDIFVAPFLILGLAELIKLLQYPTPLRALLTGVNAGLAGGAK